MKKHLFTACLFIMCMHNVFAQIPVITSITEVSGPVNLEVGISGTGFDALSSNLKVRFGAAEAEVTSASPTYIQVKIPAGTSVASVSVTNLVSGLTAYSSNIFFIDFSGDGSPQGAVDATSFISALQLLDLEIADFDQDGKNDIVVTKIDDLATDIVIYHNVAADNSISFNELDKNDNPEFDIGDPSSGVSQGDIDGDGKPDFVITRAGNSRTEISVFRNISTPGSIKFAASESYFIPGNHLSKKVKIRDLDRDGKPDVIVSNTTNNELTIFKNKSIIGAIDLSDTTIIHVDNVPNTAAISIEDLDNDGKPEIVIVPFINANVYILKNQSTSSGFNFSDPIVLSVSGNLNNISIGDLNNDGKNDIVVSKTIQNEIAVLLNNTSVDISFEAPALFPSNTAPWGLDLVDFDGNGLTDILVSSNNGNFFTYFKNETITTLVLTKEDYSQTKNSLFIKSADLSNDGKPDFAMTTYNDADNTYEMVVIRNNFCFQPEILQGSDLTICNGQTVRLEATPALDVTYVWSRNGVDVKTSTEPFYDITLAGDYVVTAKTESDNCIIASAMLTATSNAATIPPDPTASNSGPGCVGSTLTLLTPTVANVTYEWTGPDGFTSADQNPVLLNVTSAISGVYEVTLINPEGCKSNIAGSTNVEIIATPDFTIGSNDPDNFCEGGSALLSVDPVSGYTYQWLLDDVIIPGASSTTLSVLTKGMYKMQANNSTFSCTVTSDPYEIITFPPSPFTIIVTGNISFCEGDSTILTVPGTYISYLWNDGSTVNSIVAKATGTYTAQATNSNGCISTDQIDVTAFLSPAIVINAEKDTITLGESSILTASGAFTYAWTPGELLSDSTIANPAASPTITSLYTVAGTDTNGCTSSSEITLTVQESSDELAVTAPKLFSPNNDGFDDLWVIEGILNYPDCKLVVFDRNGNTVFDSKPYINNWNGVHNNGSEVPEGPYFYILSCDDGKSSSGSVSIIR